VSRFIVDAVNVAISAHERDLALDHRAWIAAKIPLTCA
jgi:hypothetical protein